jgi:hypothetical protein
MKDRRRRTLLLVVLLLLGGLVVHAQQSQPTAPTVTNSIASGVSSPRLVKFGGILKDGHGRPISGIVGITFALYKDQQGGAPLWLETQNVEIDSQGNYVALLGAATKDGLALELFTSGESRWLGIEPQSDLGIDVPRVLLVSVPYALKAADADTVGGMPASAFMLAPTDANSTTAPTNAISKAVSSKADTSKPGTQSPLSSNGPNTLAKWDNSGTNLVNSVVVDNNGNVGIGTSTASQRLVVTGTGANVWTQFDADTGFNSGLIYSENNIPKGYLYHLAGTGDLRFADGNGGDKVALQLSTGNMGIGTNNPSQRLVVTGKGANVWTEFDSATGFNSGLIYSENDIPKGYLYHLAGSADLRFADGNGVDKLAVQLSTGNLGIGTNNPGQKLVVTGPVGNVWSQFDAAQGFNSGFIYSENNIPQNYLYHPAGTADLRFADGVGADKVTLQMATGRVGIGTNAPTQKLEVAGTAKVATLQFGDNTTMSTAAIGTITGVTAGAGLTGGASSGNAPLALNAAALTRAITYLGGCDTCSVLADTDSQRTIFVNYVGAMTINSITCFSDAGSPVVNVQRNDGSPANVLTSNLTCSTSGATSTNIAVGEGVLNLNDQLDFAMVTAGGAAHRVTVIIKTTVN